MRRSRIVAVNGIPKPGATGVRIRLTEAAVAALRLLMLTERTHPAHRFAMRPADRLVIEPPAKRHGRSASYPGIAEPDRYRRRRTARRVRRRIARVFVRWPRGSRFGSHRSVTRIRATGPRYGHRPRRTARAGA